MDKLCISMVDNIVNPTHEKSSGLCLALASGAFLRRREARRPKGAARMFGFGCPLNVIKVIRKKGGPAWGRPFCRGAGFRKYRVGLRGGFFAAEERQFEHFEEAIHVGETDVPKPLALLLDRGKDVIIPVWSVIVLLCEGFF
jgi:hypothetical protein